MKIRNKNCSECTKTRKREPVKKFLFTLMFISSAQLPQFQLFSFECSCNLVSPPTIDTQLKINSIETSTTIFRDFRGLKRKEFTMNCRFASFNNNRQLYLRWRMNQNIILKAICFYLYKQKQQLQREKNSPSSVHDNKWIVHIWKELYWLTINTHN